MGRTVCALSLSKKSYMIVKNGLSRTPAPTIWLFFVNDFVEDAALGVPKQFFCRTKRALGKRPYNFYV